MTTTSRTWQVAGAAVSIGVALPVIGGNALVASHVLAALSRVAAILA